jgi:hypothetical protein
MSDVDLVEVMSEATRDESTGIAQRLAAVAELFVRRCGVLAEHEWWCVGGCDAVAAEVSAVQNISHHRAVGQVQFACALWHRLPALATVVVSGVIDFRMVSTIIGRSENVDAAVLAEPDEAIARHCVKWMKLSGPKLRDRVDLWVARFDPVGVRVPPTVIDNRYVDIDPASPGMAATATLKPVRVPTDASPEMGYRPSAGLAQFLRWRDPTCRRGRHPCLGPEALLPHSPRVKASRREPLPAFVCRVLGLGGHPEGPSLSARSDPDWNCDILSPYRRRA